MTEATDNSNVTNLQIPEQVRAFAEKSVLQAREGFNRLKEATETHNGTVTAVLTTATKGASEYSGKLLDFARANTAANFDFAQELLSVKTPSDALAAWTTFTRKQVETITAQGKELVDLSKKIATETAEPIKSGANKLLHPT